MILRHMRWIHQEGNCRTIREGGSARPGIEKQIHVVGRGMYVTARGCSVQGLKIRDVYAFSNSQCRCFFLQTRESTWMPIFWCVDPAPSMLAMFRWNYFSKGRDHWGSRVYLDVRGWSIMAGDKTLRSPWLEAWMLTVIIWGFLMCYGSYKPWIGC